MSDNRDWLMCQQFSDQLLADGLLILRDQPTAMHTSVISKGAGNYLVSLDNDALYVGEAKNLAKRTRQQFTQKTSMFYKTFLARSVGSSPPIDKFRLRCTETHVGRKELEEFGIVNVPCRLNKFQLGKRSEIASSLATGGWCELQRHHAGILAQGESELFSQSFVRWSAASLPKLAGLYVVRSPEGDDILYIGESSDVGARYKTHGADTYFSALRRHVGTELLEFSLKEKSGRLRDFTPDEDLKVSHFIRSCRVAYLPVTLGRCELEEAMIRKYHPLLNRKDNKL